MHEGLQKLVATTAACLACMQENSVIETDNVHAKQTSGEGRGSGLCPVYKVPMQALMSCLCYCCRIYLAFRCSHDVSMLCPCC